MAIKNLADADLVAINLEVTAKTDLATAANDAKVAADGVVATALTGTTDLKAAAQGTYDIATGAATAADSAV